MRQDRRLWLGRLGALAALSVTAPLGPFGAARAAGTTEASCSPLLDHALRPLMGAEPVNLCERFGGQVLLIVNTASKCGFTHQFEDLEALHQRYAERGLSVLGFPSDDFRQELDSEAAVAEFCELNYGVSFPMFQKVNVRGQAAHPLYAGLAHAAGGAPSWNFYKYLIDRDGQPQGLFRSSDEPLGDAITGAIEQLI